jgi:prepilin-type N-terminal cleavage/methylation domain-containing protein
MILKHLSDRRGFTLIELVIIIVVLGIVAAVAIPKFGSLTENARINATKEEMLTLKKAIVGDPRVTAGGRYINRGFEGDVGHPPANLTELAVKPDSLAAYDKFTRIGWNGPYIDSAGQEYMNDAWGNAYVYDRVARTITATGTTPNIVISF